MPCTITQELHISIHARDNRSVVSVFSVVRSAFRVKADLKRGGRLPDGEFKADGYMIFPLHGQRTILSSII